MEIPVVVVVCAKCNKTLLTLHNNPQFVSGQLEGVMVACSEHPADGIVVSRMED